MTELSTEQIAKAASSNGQQASGVVPAHVAPNGESYWPESGLTKRELFAAMAMQAILTGAVTRGCPYTEWMDQHMQHTAVKCADELLKGLVR